MVTDIGDISTNHSPTAIPTATGTAVLEVTHHTPHPATMAAHATFQPLEVPITIHTMTHPTGTVAPHPTLTTSPADITHTIIPWTRAGLTPASPTTLHKKHSQEKSSHAEDLQTPISPHLSKTVIIQDSLSDSSSDTDSDTYPLNY